ncbi:MAG: TolC family protein [Clostridia bacterium]|nr:TolC family protein [Clostridia bacterium]
MTGDPGKSPCRIALWRARVIRCVACLRFLLVVALAMAPACTGVASSASGPVHNSPPPSDELLGEAPTSGREISWLRMVVSNDPEVRKARSVVDLARLAVDQLVSESAVQVSFEATPTMTLHPSSIGLTGRVSIVARSGLSAMISFDGSSSDAAGTAGSASIACACDLASAVQGRMPSPDLITAQAKLSFAERALKLRECEAGARIVTGIFFLPAYRLSERVCADEADLAQDRVDTLRAAREAGRGSEHALHEAVAALEERLLELQIARSEREALAAGLQAQAVAAGLSSGIAHTVSVCSVIELGESLGTERASESTRGQPVQDEEAIQSACPAVELARGEMLAAESALAHAGSEHAPSLSAWIRVARAYDDQVSWAPARWQLGCTFSTAFGVSEEAARAARLAVADLARAQASLNAAQKDAVAAVQDSVTSLTRLSAEVRLNRMRLDWAEDHLSTVQAQHQAGLVSGCDVAASSLERDRAMAKLAVSCSRLIHEQLRLSALGADTQFIEEVVSLAEASYAP